MNVVDGRQPSRGGAGGLRDPAAAKAALRDEARLRRDMIAPAARAEHARVIARRFMDELLPRLVGAAPVSVISAYWPIRSEVDPQPLLELLAQAGYVTCLPVVAHPRLIFRVWRPGDPLADADFGTRGPTAGAPERDPDLVVTPCLAFDRDGGRLGYGAGHFDRALARLRAARPGVRAVALAFAAQERVTTFSQPHDQPLDAIVTERELVLPGRAGA